MPGPQACSLVLGKSGRPDFFNDFNICDYRCHVHLQRVQHAEIILLTFAKNPIQSNQVDFLQHFPVALGDAIARHPFCNALDFKEFWG